MTIRSAEASAPRYVNVAHSASLMYSFACIVLLELARASRWPAGLEVAAVALPVLLFAAATGTYILHAALRDSDNQFLRPYRIGSRLLPPGVFEAGGWFLALGEMAGFLVLAAGAVVAIVGGE